MQTENQFESFGTETTSPVFTFKGNLQPQPQNRDQAPARSNFKLFLISFLSASMVMILACLIMLWRTFIGSSGSNITVEKSSVSQIEETQSTASNRTDAIAPAPEALALLSRKSPHSRGLILSLSEDPADAEQISGEPEKFNENSNWDERKLSHEIARHTSKLTNSSIEPGQFASLIIRQAEASNTDPVLLVALIAQISKFDPKFKSKDGRRGMLGFSVDKAIAISQATNVKWNSEKDLLDPSYSVKLAAEWLGYLSSKYNFSERQLILAFHWDADKLVEAINKNVFAPDESRSFATEVQSRIELLRNSKKINTVPN